MIEPYKCLYRDDPQKLIKHLELDLEFKGPGWYHLECNRVLLIIKVDGPYLGRNSWVGLLYIGDPKHDMMEAIKLEDIR